MNTLSICHLQISPTIRLRREAWGEVAFNRANGDLLELDREGFTVLTVLHGAHSVAALQRRLRHLGYTAGRKELLAFLRQLDQRGLVRRVSADALPLPGDQ